MGAGLVAMLQKERARQEDLLRQITGLGDGVTPVRDLVEPEGCIFYAAITTRLVPRSLCAMRAKFKAVVLKAGLPLNTVPHALRHTGITTMLAGDAQRPGISVADAAKIAGHSKSSTTADVYAHAIQANLVRGADLADALIAAPQPAAVEQLKNSKPVGVTRK
jgi:integrase